MNMKEIHADSDQKGSEEVPQDLWADGLSQPVQGAGGQAQDHDGGVLSWSSAAVFTRTEEQRQDTDELDNNVDNREEETIEFFIDEEIIHLWDLYSSWRTTV